MQLIFINFVHICALIHRLLNNTFHLKVFTCNLKMQLPQPFILMSWHLSTCQKSYKLAHNVSHNVQSCHTRKNDQSKSPLFYIFQLKQIIIPNLKPQKDSLIYLRNILADLFTVKISWWKIKRRIGTVMTDL